MLRLQKMIAALTLLMIGWPLAMGVARADSWLPPSVQTVLSADGRARLTITPRAIGSQLSYFEDRVQGREPAGQRPGFGSRQPIGRLEVRDGRRWRAIWERPLVNDVSPVSALVANDGSNVVTFDNWHSIGFGDNVVVIYRADGTPVRSLRLNEIVPGYMIDAFARSVSSLYWQGQGTRIEGDRLRLAIVEPGSEIPSSARGFFVDIDLATGAVARIEETDLARWSPRACELHRRAVADLQAYLEREQAGLVAPTSPEAQAWERYGHQVAQRLYMPEGPEGGNMFYPGSPEVIRLPELQEFMAAETLSNFRALLAASTDDVRRRLFLAISQDRLVAEVEQAAAGLRPGQLNGVEMIFVADAAHWRRIEAVLRDSGATLRQVNPATPLPQHPHNLENLPQPRSVDPACAA